MKKDFFEKKWFKVLHIILMYLTGIFSIWDAKELSKFVKTIVSIMYSSIILLLCFQVYKKKRKIQEKLIEADVKTSIQPKNVNNSNSNIQLDKTEKLEENSEQVIENNINNQDNNKIVYVSERGEKYHTSYCRTLKGKKYPISLEEAISQGKTACNICNP